MTIQLEYINHFFQLFPIMLALYLMLLIICNALNYASIIGWSLLIIVKHMVQMYADYVHSYSCDNKYTKHF